MNTVGTPSGNKSIPAPPAAQSVLGGVAIPAAQTLNEAHPLEARVTGWRDAQEAAHMELLRAMVGPSEPIRRVTEKKLLDSTTFVPAVMGGPSMLHHDVLRGAEDCIDWEDVYREDKSETTFHSELEARMFKQKM